MRILHTTDLHFRRTWFDWLTDQAGQFDACCVTGDLLDVFSGLSPQANLHSQARWVRDWLRSFPGKLFVCSGNHDCWPQSPHVVDTEAEGGWLRKGMRPGRIFIDGDSAELGGYRVVCTPWGSKPEADGVLPHVVLCHAPPEGTAIAWGAGQDDGDREVALAIAGFPRGSMLLSGHVHEPRQWYARLGNAHCFNPGFDSAGSIPNHIIIDFSTGRASFHGWGRELVAELS